MIHGLLIASSAIKAEGNVSELEGPFTEQDVSEVARAILREIARQGGEATAQLTSMAGIALTAYPLRALSGERRYVAELTPDAKKDLLSLHQSPDKQALRLLLDQGHDLGYVQRQGYDVEDLVDPRSGWSFLRSGGLFCLYRPLTDQERGTVSGAGRHADILVARIVTLDSAWNGAV